MFRLFAVCLLSLYIGAGSVLAQAEEAAALFNQQDWAGAIKAYGELVKSDSTNPVNWYRLGYAQHVSGDPASAIDNYLKADNLGFAPGFTRFNLACAYAQTGNTDAAFEWIDKAIESGFAQGDALDTDPDLEPLRADSRWDVFRSRANHKLHPCEFDDRYNQLDFWVGDWGLFLTDSGARAGNTKVEKLEHGCLIRESYSSVYGSTGTSVSFVDPETGKWSQVWTNDHGNVNHFTGELVDGAMLFTGTMYPFGGNPQAIKITLTPNADGTVHHLTEISSDNGKSWEAYFDALYRKQTEE